MSSAKSASSGRSFTIVEPVEGEDGPTLKDPVTGATYHVVDYADPLLKERLAGRAAGNTVRVELAPADPDGLDWILTRVRPGGPGVAGM